MRRKYRNTGSVILGILLFAVACVAVIVFIIHQNGLRYVKSDAGIKFFGNTDKNDDIINGRLWFESDAASVSLQKFYIIEVKDKDSEYIEFLGKETAMSVSYNTDNTDNTDNTGGGDILGNIIARFPDELTGDYPLNNFIFNQSESGVFFRSETFEVLIKDYENDFDNILMSGEIYTYDGIKWVLNLPEHMGHTSYKDIEVVQSENSSRKYKGDVISFIKEEKDITYASFVLSDGSVLVLYPARDAYRLSYDKGALNGDLYIGKLNRSFEKNGRGLYFSKGGDIYYGDFFNGKRTGECEIFSYLGDIYSGRIIDGKRTGGGTFTWSDGWSYTGEFTDNMKNGEGVNIYADGSVYEGNFVNDVKQGKGKYTWANGDYYEGDYVNDLKDGVGKYSWAGGDYYEGEFKRDIIHGWGIFYWTSGRTYMGWFSDGRMVLEKPDDIDGDEGESAASEGANANEDEGEDDDNGGG